MDTFYRIVSELNFNLLNVLGYISLGAILFLGGKMLFISARKMLKEMEGK